MVTKSEFSHQNMKNSVGSSVFQGSYRANLDDCQNAGLCYTN